jgi:ribosomal protein S18 acetylase RimI-like enzyme
MLPGTLLSAQRRKFAHIGTLNEPNEPNKPMTTLNMRPMQIGDLEYASSLTQGEGWHSETLEEFTGFFSHDPAGCMIAEQGGRRVGIGVATAYRDVGFLGQIVVARELRGQGIGNQIVTALLSHLRTAGVRSIYLDATKAGAPLYQRHGFRKDQPSLRYSGMVRGALHPHVRPMRVQDLDTVCALDRQWWGADRTFFLVRRWQLYPDLCHVLEQGGAIQGYVLARRRGGKLWVGPWGAAAHVERPEALLEALAVADGIVPIHAGVLASSCRAVTAFDHLGFDLAVEPPWRMVCGPDTETGRSMEMLANGTSAKG